VPANTVSSAGSCTTAEAAVGLHPSDLVLDPEGRRLYVANANSDTVSAIDAVALRVVGTIAVRPRDDLPFGSAPNALALSVDGRTLFVANGGNNAVAVVRLGGEGGPGRGGGVLPAADARPARTAAGRSMRSRGWSRRSRSRIGKPWRR